MAQNVKKSYYRQIDIFSRWCDFLYVEKIQKN